jgi:hypothetical protein
MLQVSDMQIPILFGIQPRSDDAVLAEDGQAVSHAGYTLRFSRPATSGHPLGCTCCTRRSPAAEALGRLFRVRATGMAPFFKRVVVLASPAGEAAVREAVAGDVMTAARYRLTL